MNIKGLNKQEVLDRTNKNQINKTNNPHIKSIKTIILSNVFTLFNGLNCILAFLVIITGKYRNMLFMFTILINTIIGIIQEIRAKKELDNLRILVEPKTTVLRDDKEIEINNDEIVIDDIILLRMGNQIPADCIIVDGSVGVNESLLTGEQDIQIRNKDEQLLSGSFITSGKAYARVNRIGNDSFAGKILNSIKVEKRQDSRLRDALNFILKTIFTFIMPLGIALFLKQYYIGKQGINDSITGTVAAMVGMMPEGLVLLTSLALTIGSLMLARKKTLVKEIYSLETLARCDTLCLDKTGTLSTGNMKVIKVISYQNDIYNLIANMINIIDDNNQTALALKKHFKVKEEISYTSYEAFSSQNKYSSLTINNDKYYLGAHDNIDLNHNEEIENTIKEYENQGYRVLTLVKNKDIIGLIILEDEIRENAKDIVDYLMKQDVNVKIISGDNINTVSNLLKKNGFKLDDQLIDCSNINENELKEYALSKNIFGRAKPEDKKIIIDTLKENGHVIGMVGDGVNDVLALKAADFSIAMVDGADSTKNIANVVLMDNDFAHIPDIINEGRRVINNIKRTATLFLSKTAISFFVSILTLFALNEYPFVPIQLTLVSALCIGIPSFILSLEPSYERIKGDFLESVFQKVLPIALSYIITIFIISLLNHFNYINPELNQTISLFIISSVLIYTIYKISIPLTTIRIALIVFATIGILVTYIFAYNLLYLKLLDNNSILICIGLCLFNILLVKLIEKTKFIHNAVKRIDDAY